MMDDQDHKPDPKVFKEFEAKEAAFARTAKIVAAVIAFSIIVWFVIL